VLRNTRELSTTELAYY